MGLPMQKGAPKKSGVCFLLMFANGLNYACLAKCCKGAQATCNSWCPTVLTSFVAVMRSPSSRVKCYAEGPRPQIMSTGRKLCINKSLYIETQSPHCVGTWTLRVYEEVLLGFMPCTHCLSTWTLCVCNACRSGR